MKLINFTETLALQLLFLMGTTIIFSSISLLFNFKIMGIFFVLGIISSIVFGACRIYKLEQKKINILIINILFILILMVALFTTGKFFDHSWDGQSYHQEALINLQQGWNPIYDKELDESFISNFWINHYAKGTWFFGASVFDLFGEIEYGKVGNLLLLITSFLLLFSTLRRYKLNIFLSLLVSFLCTMNPVTTNQVFSFYIDGQLASLIVILLSLFIINSIKESLAINISIIITIILMINIKFTALGYAIIICMLPLMIKLYNLIIVKKERRLKRVLFNLINNKELNSICLGIFLGIFIVGASSYLSNTIDHKHPFYPLSGEGKVDIMSYNTPESLNGKSSIEKLFISIFAESTNNRNEEVRIKFPLNITDEEKKYIWQVDTRIGGFGPLFGAVLLISIAGILIWHNIFKETRNVIILMILGILLLTIVINPEPWWARYIPQLWLIPSVILIILLKSPLSKGKIIFNCLLSVVILLNIFYVQNTYFENISLKNEELQLQLESLREYGQYNNIDITFDTFRSNRERLSSYEINYVEQKELTCDNPIYLKSSTTQICIENIELYNKLKLKYE